MIKTIFWTDEETREHWPKHKEDSHKGTYGRVGIVAGSEYMPGAAIMATGATLRSGAGLTTLNAPKSIISSISSRYPETMFYSREDSFEKFYEDKDVIAIGPGMEEAGTHERVKALIKEFSGTLLLDATALYTMKDLFEEIEQRSAPLIITPHPGEMARILEIRIKDVEEARTHHARALATELKIYVVLKGQKTLLATPNGQVYVNTSGNSALAKGGSGDVLAGVIAGFAPRYQFLTHAVASAIYIHGLVADELIKEQAVETVIATDVIEKLKTTMKGWRQ